MFVCLLVFIVLFVFYCFFVCSCVWYCRQESRPSSCWYSQSECPRPLIVQILIIPKLLVWSYNVAVGIQVRVAPGGHRCNMASSVRYCLNTFDLHVKTIFWKVLSFSPAVLFPLRAFPHLISRQECRHINKCVFPDFPQSLGDILVLIRWKYWFEPPHNSPASSLTFLKMLLSHLRDLCLNKSFRRHFLNEWLETLMS